MEAALKTPSPINSEKAKALQADRDTRGIHHDEHHVEASVGLADQIAFCAVEMHYAGCRCMDAHFVFD